MNLELIFWICVLVISGVLISFKRGFHAVWIVGGIFALSLLYTIGATYGGDSFKLIFAGIVVVVGVWIEVRKKRSKS